MDERLITQAESSLPYSNELHHGPHTRSRKDFERGRAIAESFARTVYSAEETLHVADQMFTAGLISCTQGDLSQASNQLTRSLIGSALAIWQLDRLASASRLSRDMSSAHIYIGAAERHLRFLPGRINLAVSSLCSAGADARHINELKTVVSAFVAGCGLARQILPETESISWARSFDRAFDISSSPERTATTSEFGVPEFSSGATPLLHGNQPGRGACPGLSSREREVLSQIVAGLTTPEIAYRLGVKTTTVSTLVGRIFNKLGVNNRPSAVAAALRYGLCTQED